jgi:hypothetical protein
MICNHFSTPPASNRFTSRSLSTYTPPTGGGPFGSEAEPELIQPSPHFLDRGLEALRQKKVKGALQLAVAVQPHAADDVVPVAVWCYTRVHRMRKKLGSFALPSLREFVRRSRYGSCWIQRNKCTPDVGRSIRVYHSLVSVFVINVRYQTVERTHLRLFNTSTF